MDTSFFNTANLEFVTIGAILIGVFLMMRFMPRLMAGVPFVDAKAVQELINGGKDIVIIDVRTAGEFTGNLGHIAGAINLDAAALSSRLSDADGQFDDVKKEPVFVVCRTENRAPRTAKMLTKAGFSSVCIIKGGMAGWNRQGLPVEK